MHHKSKSRNAQDSSAKTSDRSNHGSSEAVSSGKTQFEAAHQRDGRRRDVERPEPTARSSERFDTLVSRPSDVLTLAELKAFAADVADFVEESQWNLLADRMIADIDRLERARARISPAMRMRANHNSAEVRSSAEIPAHQD